MSRGDLPFDVEVVVRTLPVDVPGIGRVALGEMTAEHHERYHASLARDVAERLGRIVAAPRESSAVTVGTALSVR